MHIAGVTRNVTAQWAAQQARNLLISLDDTRTAGIRYLIRDNAGYFTEGFDAVFTAVGARVVPVLPGVPGSLSAGSARAAAKPPTGSSSPANVTCGSSSRSTPTTTMNIDLTDHSDSDAPTASARPNHPP
ncbi:hypothetical protein GCM10009753_58550 [Streptantibioticus ferralitis]